MSYYSLPLTTLSDISTEKRPLKGLANTESPVYEHKLLEYQAEAWRRADASNIAADSFKPNLDTTVTAYKNELEKYKDLLDEGIEQHIFASYEAKHNVIMGHISKRFHERQLKANLEQKADQNLSTDTPLNNQPVVQNSQPNEITTTQTVSPPAIEHPEKLQSSKPETVGKKPSSQKKELAEKKTASKQTRKIEERIHQPLKSESKAQNKPQSISGSKTRTKPYDFAEKQMKHNVKYGHKGGVALLP